MISEPFAKVLAAGRVQFNQRVTEARRRFPAFDTAAFADFLQGGVDSVIQAVARLAPERAAFVALVAYDMALELVGQSLAGPRARSEMVDRLWRELMPEYARLIAEHPVEVLGTLSNAAINLEKIAGTRPDQWLREMAALTPRIESLAQLQAVGQVLAWRAGVAHFRLGAIEAADRLPETLALAAFGIDAGVPWAAARAGMLADPWWRPASNRNQHPAGMEIGKFTGFGGEFAAPPEVRACQDGFFVKSAERYSLLIADACGAVLHAATKEEFDDAPNPALVKTVKLNGARLQIGQRVIDLDLPADQIALCCNAHTLAVTSPYTHAIRLLPLQ